MCRVADVVAPLEVLDVQEIKRFAGRTPVHGCAPHVRGLVNMLAPIASVIDAEIIPRVARNAIAFDEIGVPYESLV